MKFDDINGGQWKALGTKLGGADVVMAILRDEMVVTIEPRVKPQPQPNPPLLIALTPVEVVATEAFDVVKYIKRDLSRNAPAKIAYVDSSVVNDIQGLVEPAQAAMMIYPHRTSRGFQHSEARTELGGPGKIVRTTWAKLYELLKLQPKGPDSPKGALLTGGEANLFEIENANGGPRLVPVCWGGWHDGHGWHLFSRSVDSSRGWSGGRRVLSGNPLPVVPTEA